MTELEKLKVRLDIAISDTSSDTKLNDALDSAETECLTYCNLEELPTALSNVKVDLAVIRYNRSGTEGESSRGEGGISQSFIVDIPDNLKKQLNRYRKIG